MDPVLEPLIKRAAKRRKLKRVAAVAGGLAAAGVVAGGVAWSRKHPRDPKGRFRDTPDQPKKPKERTSGDGQHSKPDVDQQPKPKPDDKKYPPIAERNVDDLQGAISGFDVSKKVIVGNKGKLQPISAQEFAKKYPWVRVDFNVDKSGNPNPANAWKPHEVDQVRSAFHHFAKIYPETAKRVKFLIDSEEMATTKPKTVAMMQGAVGENGDLMMGIMFNANLRTKPDGRPVGTEVWGRETGNQVIIDETMKNPGRKLSHAFDHDARQLGWSVDMINHPGASPIELLTLHELGHALHFHGIGSSLYFNSTYGPTIREERDPVRSEFTSAGRVPLGPPTQQAVKLLYRAMNTRSAQPPSYRKREDGGFEPVISHYAKTNRGEYFAENFAWFMANRNKVSSLPGYDPATERVILEMQENLIEYENHFLFERTMRDSP